MGQQEDRGQTMCSKPYKVNRFERDFLKFKITYKTWVFMVETSWVSPESESNSIYQGEFYLLDPGGLRELGRGRFPDWGFHR
jgi:hypothetical protein